MKPTRTEKLAMFRAAQTLARTTQWRSEQDAALYMLRLLVNDIGPQPEA